MTYVGISSLRLYEYHYTAAQKYKVNNVYWVGRIYNSGDDPELGTLLNVSPAFTLTFNFIPDDPPYMPSTTYISRHTPNEVEMIPEYDHSKTCSIAGYVPTQSIVNYEKPDVTEYNGPSTITKTGNLTQGDLKITFNLQSILVPTDWEKIKLYVEFGPVGSSTANWTFPCNNSYYIYIIDDSGRCLSENGWEIAHCFYQKRTMDDSGSLKLDVKLDTPFLGNARGSISYGVTNTPIEVSVPISTYPRLIKCYIISENYFQSTENWLKFFHAQEVASLVIPREET
jgi:hypothetical protein